MRGRKRPHRRDWEVLGLEPGADPKDVRRAYRERRALYESDSLATYTLVPAGVVCDPLVVHINLNTPVPGGAVVYEPFDLNDFYQPACGNYRGCNPRSLDRIRDP